MIAESDPDHLPPPASLGAPPTPPEVVRRGGFARAVQWIAPLENPSGVIYGVILIGALLAAESGRHESYIGTVASALIAAALYWLAHAYSTVLGRRLSNSERLTAPALLDALVRDWALIRGAAIPVVALLTAGALGAAQETAVTAGLWSAIASLVMLELAAGLRSRASLGELVLEVGVGLAMGTAILVLKIVLH